LGKSAVSQSLSEVADKGKAKEESSAEAKIGLTLQVSQQDLADFQTAGELLKGESERMSFGSFCLSVARPY
jgi:hypothetical protein